MKKEKMFSVALFMAAMLEMGMMSMSAALADIAAAFPNCSSVAVQTIMTLPNLTIVITSLFVDRLSRRIPHEKLLTVGVVIFVIPALGFVFCSSIYLLYLWAAILGVGIGLIISLCAVLVVEHYEGKNVTRMSGITVAASSLGGFVMSVISGVLTSWTWNAVYLVNLIAIPAAVVCLRVMPKCVAHREERDESSADHRKIKFSGEFIAASLMIFAFMTVYGMFTTNNAGYVSELGIGNSTIAGLGAGLALLGSMATGTTFNVLYRRLKNLVPALASLTQLCGIVIMINSASVAPYIVACILQGCGVGLMLPYGIVAVSQWTNEAGRTMGAAIASTIAPDISVFLAPFMYTRLSALIFGSTTVDRFRLMLVTSAVFFAVFLAAGIIINRRAGRETVNQ